VEVAPRPAGPRDTGGRGSHAPAPSQHRGAARESGREPDLPAAREDQLLLAAVAGKDQLALRRLYERHGGLLLHIAFDLVGSWESAEEVVQDVFVQCWSKASTYEPRRGSAGGWLVAMTRNRAIDYVRRANSRSRKGAGDVSLEAVPPALLAHDTGIGSRFDFGGMAAALNELPRSERTAILMSVHAGLTHMEIADLLQAPPGTVKSWIRRGLQRVRTAAEREGYGR
jgi:RNA polymerase sigma-70 factor (ECF subfamily)